MSPKFAKRLRIVVIILFGLMLGYCVYITQKNNRNSEKVIELSKTLKELTKITSTTPDINLEKILSKEPIYLPGEKITVYEDRFRDNPALARNAAISDSTMRNLQLALNLKNKELTNITNLYTTTKAENLALKQKPNTKDFEYRDNYIYVKLNDSTKVITNIDVKSDLSLVNYYKRKWFLSPKEYYTSVISKSPYLKVDSIGKVTKANPKVVFSMYLDTRYYNNIENFDSGFLTSTLNAEINTDNTISWILGAGVMSNMVYVKTIAVAGVKINLWRIRK